MLEEVEQNIEEIEQINQNININNQGSKNTNEFDTFNSYFKSSNMSETEKQDFIKLNKNLINNFNKEEQVKSSETIINKILDRNPEIFEIINQENEINSIGYKLGEQFDSNHGMTVSIFNQLANILYLSNLPATEEVKKFINTLPKNYSDLQIILEADATLLSRMKANFDNHNTLNNLNLENEKTNKMDDKEEINFDNLSDVFDEEASNPPKLDTFKSKNLTTIEKMSEKDREEATAIISKFTNNMDNIDKLVQELNKNVNLNLAIIGIGSPKNSLEAINSIKYQNEKIVNFYKQALKQLQKDFDKAIADKTNYIYDDKQTSFMNSLRMQKENTNDIETQMFSDFRESFYNSSAINVNKIIDTIRENDAKVRLAIDNLESTKKAILKKEMQEYLKDTSSELKASFKLIPIEKTHKKKIAKLIPTKKDIVGMDKNAMERAEKRKTIKSKSKPLEIEKYNNNK